MSDDMIPCDRCGTEIAYGHKDGDRFICSHCHLWEESDVTAVVGDSATCECGAETHFRYQEGLPKQQITVEGGLLPEPPENQEKTATVEYRPAGWICPRCQEVFETEEAR